MNEASFGETSFGDITLITPEDIPDHDILLAELSCQPFSIVSMGLGLEDTRGSFFFNIESKIKGKNPKGFLLEKVKRILTHDGGCTFRVITDRFRALRYVILSSQPQ